MEKNPPIGIRSQTPMNAAPQPRRYTKSRNESTYI